MNKDSKKNCCLLLGCFVSGFLYQAFLPGEKLAVDYFVGLLSNGFVFAFFLVIGSGIMKAIIDISNWRIFQSEKKTILFEVVLILVVAALMTLIKYRILF